MSEVFGMGSERKAEVARRMYESEWGPRENLLHCLVRSECGKRTGKAVEAVLAEPFGLGYLGVDGVAGYVLGHG